MPPLPQARSENSCELQQVTRTKCTLLLSGPTDWTMLPVRASVMLTACRTIVPAANGSLAVGRRQGRRFVGGVYTCDSNRQCRIETHF
jgi:hypothetical protein